LKTTCNATTLVYLAKLGKLNLLKDLFKEVLIPYEVYVEVVVKGKKDFALEAGLIEEALKEGWIKKQKIKAEKKLLKFAFELDKGETEVIQLARNSKADLVLIDDASARTIAESFGLNVKGTVFVLLKAYSKKLLSLKEAKELLNRLIFAGFRLSPELYAKILQEIEK